MNMAYIREKKNTYRIWWGDLKGRKTQLKDIDVDGT
jgi:hypothetical protein